MFTFGMVTTRASASYTIPALNSFFEHTQITEGDSFYLIDNDYSLENNSLKNFPHIKVITNETPKSFSANVNQIISRCLQSKNHLVFLNNDLFFTPKWFDSLFLGENIVTSPLSNREAQYKLTIEVSQSNNILSQYALKDLMRLEDVIGSEDFVNAISHAHGQVVSGKLDQLTLPFYCVQIPYPVLKGIGLFDEGFGIAGGEDFDYCLRCWQKGFSVSYALTSYIIHFGGKATWDANEASYKKNEIEQNFLNAFTSKWGADLQNLAFNFDLIAPEHVRGLQKERKYKELIEALKIQNS